MPRVQPGNGSPSKTPANEPVMTLVISLVGALLALLAAFGVDLSPEQIGAIGGFVVAALGFGLYVRSKVKPTRNIEG